MIDATNCRQSVSSKDQCTDLRISREISAEHFRVPSIEMAVEMNHRHSTEAIICRAESC